MFFSRSRIRKELREVDSLLLTEGYGFPRNNPESIPRISRELARDAINRLNSLIVAYRLQIKTGSAVSAEAHHMLAFVYFASERPDEALGFAETAFETRRKILGNNHAETATTARLLAFIHASLVDLRKGLEFFRFYKSSYAWDRHFNSDDYLVLLLEELFFVIGASAPPADVNECIEEILSYCRKDEIILTRIHSLARQKLGEACEQCGTVRDAEAQYKLAIQIQDRLKDKDSRIISMAWSGLYRLYSDLGDAELATDAMRNVQANFALIADVEIEDQVAFLAEQGKFFVKAKMLDEAERSFAIGMDLVRGKKNQVRFFQPVVVMLTGLADIASSRKQFDTELRHFAELQDLFAEAKLLEGQQYRYILARMVTTYYDMGEFKKQKKVANLLIKKHKAERGDVVSEELRYVYLTLGLTNAFEKNFPRSMKMFESAIRCDDTSINELFAIGSERQRLDAALRMLSPLWMFLSAAVAHPESGNVSRAFALAQRRKLLAGVAARRINRAAQESEDEDVQRLSSEIRRLRNDIVRNAYVRARGQPPTTELISKKDRLERELASLLSSESAPEWFNDLNVKSVARNLHSDAVVVDYVRIHPYDFSEKKEDVPSGWLEPIYVAFVVVGKSTDVVLLEVGDAKKIDQLVAQFRQSLDVTEPQDRAANVEPMQNRRARSGFELRKRVLDPILRKAGSATQLIISADGELNLLPFDALPMPRGRFVIDDYTVSYVAVVSDLVDLKDRESLPTGPPAVYADPAPNIRKRSSKASDRSFELAPGMRQEGLAVAGLLNVTPLLGREATAESVLSLQAPQILHLATHGFLARGVASDEPPTDVRYMESIGTLKPVLHPRHLLLGSGILLAGYESWIGGKNVGTNGVLTAEEIAGMNLSATKLVTISACESGLGETIGGEGILGMRRAVHLAGAKALIMSLWRVDDIATAKLMIAFYEHIVRGVPPVGALRKAQLKLKREYPHPRYWGAFICQGGLTGLSFNKD